MRLFPSADKLIWATDLVEIDMEKKMVEDVARAMHRQHSKEMLGAIQKWEKLTPHERSAWRLIARTTIALVQNYAGEAKIQV